MRYRRNIKISREEALKYLFNATSPILGIITSLISSFIVFFIIGNFLYFARFINSYTNILISSLIFLLFGIVQYFIKKQEFVLYEKTNSEIFLYDVFSLPAILIMFASIFIYFFIPQWQATQAQDTLVSMIITIIALSLMISYIFISAWKIINLQLLSLLSGKDWYLMAEKDYFLNILALRYEESKRYGVPLSIVTIKLDMSKIKNYKRYLNIIYNKIAKSIRDIDTIVHFGELNLFYIICPITLVGAKGLLNRVTKIIKEFLIAYGLKEGIIIEATLSSLRPETQSEFDLLNPEETYKEEIKSVSNNL